MSVDLSAIAKTTAELIDRLEAEAAELGELTHVGEVAIVVECNWVDEDGDLCSGVLYRCSDGRRWFQRGMFAAAERATYQ